MGGALGNERLQGKSDTRVMKCVVSIMSIKTASPYAFVRLAEVRKVKMRMMQRPPSK